MGDGAPTRDDFPFRESVVDGADDGDGIETGVRVEVAILGSNGRLDEVGGDVTERDVSAPPSLGVCDLVEQSALAVVDLAADEGGLVILQFSGRGELVGDGDVADDGGSGSQEKNQHHGGYYGEAGPDQGALPLARSVVRSPSPCPPLVGEGWGGDVARSLWRRHSARQASGRGKAGGHPVHNNSRLTQLTRQLGGLDIIGRRGLRGLAGLGVLKRDRRFGGLGTTPDLRLQVTSLV